MKMNDEKFEKSLKAYIDRRKNRVVGAILHAYDSNVRSDKFKAIVKQKIMELSKEMFDLCVSFNTNPVFFNVLAEEALKEVEKAKAKGGNRNPSTKTSS